MKTMELAEATAPLAQYARDIQNEPLLLLVNGKPVAALLGIDGADLETLSLSFNPQFLEIIERSRARHESEGGISGDELRKRLGLTG
jgi:hypothetical protein